jgi:hypothetical protein
MSRYRRHVHRERDAAGGQEVDHEPRRLDGDRDLCLGRGRAEVRRGDDPGELEQRVVARRLFFKHVQRGARHMPRAQRIGQGLLVDDPAPRAVDHAQAGAGTGQALGVDQPARLVGERGVHGQEVGARDQAVQVRRRLDALLRGTLGRHERIEPDHLHFEAKRAAGDRHADAAEADDTERLAGQLGARELAAVPAAGVQRFVRLRDIARERQDQRQRVLGGAQRVAARCVHHHDAAPRGGRHVDVVDADAGADDGAQPARPVQHLGGQLRAASHDDPVRLRQRGGKRAGVEPRRRDHLGPRVAQDAYALVGQGLGDHNSHRAWLVQSPNPVR